MNLRPRVSGEQIHDHPDQAIFADSDRVNANDVGVAKIPEGHRFPARTLDGLEIAHVLEPEAFEREVLAAIDSNNLVDFAHSAAAQEANDLVARAVGVVMDLAIEAERSLGPTT
ncbi:MAG: hypothetical protein ABJE95_33855, partial [Byssovorax sp.]